MPRHNVNKGDGSELVIYVPVKSQLDVRVISTDLFFKGIEGGIDANLVSGDAEVINSRKRVSISSVSGDIEIIKSTGKMRLNSVSGDIRGTFTSSEVSAETVSGDVRFELAEFDSLLASSVSGDVEISGQLNDGGKLKLETVNGDISLSFKDAVNARASIRVGPGGNIRNNMSDDKVIDVFPHQQKLNMTLGTGSGKMKIGTVNGSITLNGNN